MQAQYSRIFSQFASYATIIGGLWWLLGTPATTSAKPQADTHTSDVSLNQVQNVFIETLALTERGLQDSTAIHQIVSERLAQTGYTPVSDLKSPHDIMVRVKCEERKTQTGPSKHRKGSHTSAAASRLWKGPACLFSHSHYSHFSPALRRAVTKRSGTAGSL